MSNLITSQVLLKELLQNDVNPLDKQLVTQLDLKTGVLKIRVCYFVPLVYYCDDCKLIQIWPLCRMFLLMKFMNEI